METLKLIEETEKMIGTIMKADMSHDGRVDAINGFFRGVKESLKNLGERSEPPHPLLGDVDAEQMKINDFYFMMYQQIRTDGELCSGKCELMFNIQGCNICRLFGVLSYDKTGNVEIKRHKLCRRSF